MDTQNQRRADLLGELRDLRRALMQAHWRLRVDVAAVDAIGGALRAGRVDVAGAEAMILRTWPEAGFDA